MKNKIRSIVMICFLAIAGIFGVSSALINKQVEETPVVEKADAADAFPNNHFVMFDSSSIGWWENDSAWTAAYFYGTSGNYWQAMQRNNISGLVYFCQAPSSGTYEHVIFVRMKSGSTTGSRWDGKLNQTADLDYTSGKDCFVSSGETTGTWKTYDAHHSWYLKFGVGGSWSTTFSVPLTGYKNDGTGLEMYGLVSQLDSTSYEFQFNRNGDAWFNSGYMESSCPAVSSGYLVRREGQNGQVSKEGTYDVYIKINTGSVYVQVGEEIINDYASSFLETVTCDNGVHEPSKSNWTSVANTYSALSSAPKYVFKRASAEGTSSLNKAVARYDYIIHKYTTAKYTDFAERTDTANGGGYSLGAINFTSPLTILGLGDENNLSIVIIIVSSSVALLSITALSILVIKKRKQKEE